MDTINKKQAIKIIRESTNFQGTIEYMQNSFTMNTKGDSMSKQENKVSLDSIYELVLNIKTEIQDMKDEIKDIKDEIKDIKTEIKDIKDDIEDMKIEIKDIKDDIKNIKVDINTLKQLPTISKELKNL